MGLLFIKAGLLFVTIVVCSLLVPWSRLFLFIRYYKVCLQLRLAGIPDDISNVIKVYLKFNKGYRHTKEMSKLVKLIASNKDALPFIREAIEKRLK